MNRTIEGVHQEVLRRGFKMNPCLPESVLRESEAAWGIRLPNEFRAFLTLVGNGGEGPPEYGLEMLGVGPSDDRYWEFAEHYAERVRKPFPLTSALLWGEEVPEFVTDGLLYLGNDGCGLYWVLVVSGESQGEVWQLGEDGIQPCAPRLSFLQWYDNWLDGDTDWWREYEG